MHLSFESSAPELHRINYIHQNLNKTNNKKWTFPELTQKTNKILGLARKNIIKEIKKCSNT